MSNYVVSKCNTIQNLKRKTLEQALRRMGLLIDYDIKAVPIAYRFEAVKCDAVLRKLMDNKLTSIALKFFLETMTDGTEVVKLEVVSDWIMTDFTERSFIEALTLEYTTVKAIETAQAEGFEVVEELVLEDGRRKLVLSRVA